MVGMGEECGGESGTGDEERDERGTVPEQPPADRCSGDNAEWFVRAEDHDRVRVFAFPHSAPCAAHRAPVGSRAMRITPGFGPRSSSRR